MEMQNFPLQPRSGAAYSESLGGPDGLSTKHEPRTSFTEL
jgi:hypothetical protein